MATGRVNYQVRADNSMLGSDLSSGLSLVKGFASSIINIGAKAFQSMGDALSKSFELGSGYEKSLAKASTLFGDVAVDVDGLSEKILKLSSESGISAEELNQGLYTALSSGVPVTEDMSTAIDFLRKTTMLAEGGFTDIDTAISSTMKTLNAYGMSIEDADKIQEMLIQTQNKGITTVDELGKSIAGVTPTASTLGVGFDEVSASMSILTKKGTPTAEAVTQLNGLLAELGKQNTKASKNLAKATKGTKYAGLSFVEMKKRGVGLNTILQLMNEYAEDNSLQMLDLFGNLRAGKGALALSGNSFEEFTEKIDLMRNSSGGLEDAFSKMADTTEFKVERIKKTFDNLGIQIFEAIYPFLDALMPVIQEFADELTPMITDTFKEITPQLMELVPYIKDFAKEILELTPDALKLIAEKILPKILGGIEKILPKLPELMDKFGDFIADTLPKLIDLIEDVVDLSLKLNETFEKISGTKLGSILGGIFGGFIESITIVIGLVEKLLDLIDDVIEKIDNSKLGALTGGKVGSTAKDTIKDTIIGTNPLLGSFEAVKLINSKFTKEKESGKQVETDITNSIDLNSLKKLPSITELPNMSQSSSTNYFNMTIRDNTISSDIDLDMIGESITDKLIREGQMR